MYTKRCWQVKEAAEKQWETFKAERTTGVEDISQLRQRVAQEEDRKKGERKGANGGAEEQDVKMDSDEAKEPTQTNTEPEVKKEEPAQQNGMHMEVDDENPAPQKQEVKQEASKSESKDATAATMMETSAGDEDDAVEY